MDLDARWQQRFDRTRQRLALKERAIVHLGGQCRICGYDRCPAAMVFHHEDPAEKDFEISSSMSWARIEQELRKCVLLCTRCHAEVHYGMHPSYIVLEDEDRGWDGDDLEC